MIDYLINQMFHDKDHIDLVHQWRRFFTLVGISVKDSDKSEYDMMISQYSSLLYVKVHKECPWIDGSNNVSCDKLSYTQELHLCRSLNMYPRSRSVRYPSILLGVNTCFGAHVFTYLNQCSKCRSVLVSGSYGCTCKGADTLGSLDEQMYVDIIDAAVRCNIPIEDRLDLDLKFIPSLVRTKLSEIQDEDGDYVYIISTKEIHSDREISISRIGTAISPSSFFWNIVDMYPDITLNLFLKSKDSKRVCDYITTHFCTKDRCIRNINTEYVISKVISFHLYMR